jgi:hypothetical protein
MKPPALLAILAALAVSACGSRGNAEQRVAGLPNVARVICETGGTRVEPATVKPQPDGIHLEIVNVTGKDLGLEIGETKGEPVMGTNADRGTASEVLELAPGTIWLRCRDSASTSATPGEWAPAQVVDGDDLWVEGTGVWPDCQTIVSGVLDYVRDARGEPTPSAAIRSQFARAFEPGDVLEQLGYPEESTPRFSLVRDGVIIWSFEVRGDNFGGWLVDSDARATC